jgi:hypothetical protein
VEWGGKKRKGYQACQAYNDFGLYYKKKVDDMGNTWIIDITHYLDEEGNIASDRPSTIALAGYWGSLIVMATSRDTEFIVKCRRRPKHKHCLEPIDGFIDPESNDIVWECAECGDNGSISNWRGTVWDMSDGGSFH